MGLNFIAPRISLFLELTFNILSILQVWSISGNEFTKTGNADSLVELSGNRIAYILKDYDGKHKNKLKDIGRKLQKVALDFKTNRGENLYKAENIEAIKKDIDEIVHGNKIISPFIPILKSFKKDIDGFKNQNYNNLFEAVKWCINKNLKQEGITILQESVITILYDQINYTKIDDNNREIRAMTSSYLNIKDEKKVIGFEDESG